jgi:histidinol phosphatase-like enzyme
MARRILDRDGTITPKEIDKGIKNIWKWAWLEREVCGELVSRHIRKLSEKGKAFCTL